MLNGWKISTLVLGITTAVLLFFSIYFGVKEPEYIDVVKVDTIRMRVIDTIFVRSDHVSYVEKVVVDTLYIKGGSDTIFLREQKKYEDTLSTIWVSGIEPEIDSIRYYIPRDTILIHKDTEHTIVKDKGFGHGIGVGIHAGYGLSFVNGQYLMSPQLGVSVSYTFGYYKIKK